MLTEPGICWEARGLERKVHRAIPEIESTVPLRPSPSAGQRRGSRLISIWTTGASEAQPAAGQLQLLLSASPFGSPEPTGQEAWVCDGSLLAEGEPVEMFSDMCGGCFSSHPNGEASTWFL